MDGFKAYKYYLAIKLHFSDPSFNVFVNRGRVRGSFAKFSSRNDRYLFERLARQFDDKEYIQYIASNFMYGHTDVIYDSVEAMSNYKEFLRRRQAITRTFTDDLSTVVSSGAQYNDFSGSKIPDVLQLMIGGKITLETVVILDTLDSIVDKIKGSTQISLMLGSELTKITKSRGFVKFDPDKIATPYRQFLEDVEGNNHG